jgi:phosphoglycerol geranylgeranyltransferase
MIYNYNKQSRNNLRRTVEDYIVNELRKHGTLCFPLIDSENFLNASSIAKKAELMGASGILVGGSSAVDQLELAEIVSSIKSQIQIPVILFPGNVTGISPKADAILFNKSGIASMYSLAAQYLGMRFLYLEAGSGAVQNVSPQMVSAVRKHYEGILIVGGGIRTPETAKEIADAGADAIVIGTMIEKEGNWEDRFSSIINAIRR